MAKGFIGGTAVAMPAGVRLQPGTVGAVRTRYTDKFGSGPVIVRRLSDPHHATEA